MKKKNTDRKRWPGWAKERAIEDLSNREISRVVEHLIGDSVVWLSLESRLVDGWAKMKANVENLTSEKQELEDRLRMATSLIDGHRREEHELRKAERENRKLEEIIDSFEKCCGMSREELVRRARKTAKIHRATLKNLRESMEILLSLNRKQLIESRQQELLMALK